MSQSAHNTQLTLEKTNKWLLAFYCLYLSTFVFSFQLKSKSNEKEQISAKEGEQISEGDIDIHLEDASKVQGVFQTSLTDIIIH